MKFERLQRLGNTKFQKIVNELMRGIPAILVARLILQEWGECVGTCEKFPTSTCQK